VRLASCQAGALHLRGVLDQVLDQGAQDQSAHRGDRQAWEAPRSPADGRARRHVLRDRVDDARRGFARHLPRDRVPPGRLAWRGIPLGRLRRHMRGLLARGTL